jgi:hypothetical protein
MVAVTVVNDPIEVEIPSSVADLDSFRRWASSPGFPEGRIGFLDGKVWGDMSQEEL